MRIAWFSPLPPSRSGIAAYSAEILPLLRRRHQIDVFIDGTPEPRADAVSSAHDFVWKHRRNPYELTVFQLGNASCHAYMWAYLFKYPGLVVLHDAQLHQARALWLLKRLHPRLDDYLAEFRANHPEAPADGAHLVAAGLGEGLYQQWPHVRLVLESARLAVVHNARLRADLAERYPAATLEAIEMGVADPARDGGSRRGTEVAGGDGGRLLIAAFGGVTPEKRMGPLLKAIAAVADRHPQLRVVIVGEPAEHYDVYADAKRWGVEDRVHVTGYVPDEDVPSYLAAADICACLRWPTTRETSASWLRCLAAGRATLITALAQLGDVPTLDPETWELRPGAVGEPIAVSVDILDEDRLLPVALDWLAQDAERRARLGRAARQWWEGHHRLEQMANHYEGVIARAASLPAPTPMLPAHLRRDGAETLRGIAHAMGVTTSLTDLLG